MPEDMFVTMLLETASGQVADERDHQLARHAADWAYANGWERYLDAGWLVTRPGGLQFWVSRSPSPGSLLIMTRLEPGRCWQPFARYPVADLGQALDILAVEGLLPAYLSTIGRDALEALAEAYERSATLLDQAGSDGADPAEAGAAANIIQARTLREAAASARRFAGTPLAVLR